MIKVGSKVRIVSNDICNNSEFMIGSIHEVKGLEGNIIGSRNLYFEGYDNNIPETLNTHCLLEYQVKKVKKWILF